MIKRVVFGMAVVVALGIVFANRGILDSYRLSQKLTAEESLAKQLTKENEDLKKRIYLLRTDIRYVEMVARNELGMVAEGETVIYIGNGSKGQSN